MAASPAQVAPVPRISAEVQVWFAAPAGSASAARTSFAYSDESRDAGSRDLPCFRSRGHARSARGCREYSRLPARSGRACGFQAALPAFPARAPVESSSAGPAKGDSPADSTAYPLVPAPAEWTGRRPPADLAACPDASAADYLDRVAPAGSTAHQAAAAALPVAHPHLRPDARRDR